MRRSNRLALSGISVLLLLSVAGRAAAGPFLLPPPSSAVPAQDGTGLSSRWVNGTDVAAYEELDSALAFLTPSSFALEGVGPVSLSNFLAPLGDFTTHTAMPYSPQGTPAADGWYLAARMVGAWAAREPGTYTFAVGSDDGYRITLGGVVVLNHPTAESFQRAAASFVATEAGLYPIVVEYFNGVDVGAIELSVTSGDVALASATAAVPSNFVLVPLRDLYPLDVEDGGGTTPSGAPEASDSGEDGGSLLADEPEAGDPDGGAGTLEHWHGGGCAVADGGSSVPAWLSGAFALALAALTQSRSIRSIRRRRRQGS